MKKQTVFLSMAAVLAVLSAPAFAADEAPYADRLLGNLGGMRDTLDSNGIDLNLIYNGTAWAVDGGANDGTVYEQLAEVRANVDGEKAFGIKGNSASVSFQSTLGGHPNNHVGSVEAIDNLEANPNAVRLYEAYIQQTLLNDRLTALVGVRDLNVDFVWTDMTANFIKPTFQIGQDIAQSGQNSPSIFPFTGLAATLKYTPTANTYVAGGVFDGVPQDQDHPRSMRFDLSRDDGALLIGEAGYVAHEGMTKIAVGGWTYTTTTTDLDGTGKHHTNGAYVLTSYQFYNDETAGHSVGAFARFGIADDNTMQTDWSYQAGLVGNGWVPNRPEGEIGIGITQAHNSDAYRTANAPTDESEHGFEVYYRDQLTPAIAIQPDLQYVVNPGTDTVTDDAVVAGIRLNVNF